MQATTQSSASRASGPQPEGRQQRSGMPPNVVESEALLRGQKSVAIQHNGALYRLQATRLGKLILTK